MFSPCGQTRQFISQIEKHRVNKNATSFPMDSESSELKSYTGTCNLGYW